jgi:hypothetical protein
MRTTSPYLFSALSIAHGYRPDNLNSSLILSSEQQLNSKKQDLPVIPVLNVGDGCYSRTWELAEGVEVQKIDTSNCGIDRNLQA